MEPHAFISNARVVKLAARAFGAKAAEVTGPCRSGAPMKARLLAARILRTDLGRTVVRCGEAVGRDHSTVSYEVRRAETLLAECPQMQEAYAETMRGLGLGRQSAGRQSAVGRPFATADLPIADCRYPHQPEDMK